MTTTMMYRSMRGQLVFKKMSESFEYLLIKPTLPISSIEFVIEFVIQTLDLIHCTIKSTSRSDPHSSVHVYAQEHTSIYIYIYI